jgi:hypothetical protein
MGRLIGIEGLERVGIGSLGYPSGMGFLRSVRNRTDSFIVFLFVVVEKSLPARKKTILAGASHRVVGRDENPYLGIPIP